MAGRKNGPRSRTTSMPAPIGGLNVRDAINSMPPTDAVNLINWVPQQYGVRARKGYIEWATGLGAECNSVLHYQPPIDPASGFELFACTDSDIYDVTTSTATPVSVLSLSGATGAGRMNGIMFSNTAGAFLVAASFEGGYFTYDGTTWVQRVAGVGAGEVDGVDPDNLVHVNSWKRRLWFVEKDSTNAWYLGTDAISGTISKLELGPFIKNGGRLMFITNWTIDAGEGIDDYLVFAFEGGDILIYKGTDPDTAGAFSIVGSYFIGRMPGGRRNYVQYGGDVLVMSELGIQPLSYVTRGGQSLLRVGSVDYLGKIQPRLAELVNQLFTYNGFDMTLFSKESLLVVNIPAGPTDQKVQYALQTDVNGWAVLQGMPMRCASVADNEFWFGTEDGKVCKAFTGYFDGVSLGETTGSPIIGTIQPGYSYFSAPGVYKHFLMVRPSFLSVVQPGAEVGMVVDFSTQYPTGVPPTQVPTPGVWDVSQWDAAQWGGSFNIFNDWVGVEALGFAGSVYIKTQCAGDTFLASLDYMFEFGGPM